MDTIILSVAGFYIKIQLNSTEVDMTREFFRSVLVKRVKGFIVTTPIKKPHFTIDVKWDYKQEIIYAEKENSYYVSLFRQLNKKTIQTYYHVSFLQFQTILQHALYLLLLENDGLLIHASASNIDGAHIFLGKSGSGKSTSVQLLHERYPMLSDDVSIIRKQNGNYFFYQTPLLEKNQVILKSHKPIRLKKVFFLHKAKEFSVKQINNKDVIYQGMLEQVLIMKGNNKVLGNLSDLINTHDDFYTLYFAKNKKKMIKLFHEIKEK